MESLYTFTTMPVPCPTCPTASRSCGTRSSASSRRRSTSNGSARVAAFGYRLFRPSARPAGCAGRSASRSARSDRIAASSGRGRRTPVRCACPGRARRERERLDLYDRFHRFQADAKGGPDTTPRNRDYIEQFVETRSSRRSGIPLGEKLVGVGYVDHLPDACRHLLLPRPDERKRSLARSTCSRSCGTRRARAAARLPRVPRRRLPVARIQGRFRPNEVHAGKGEWVPFLD